MATVLSTLYPPLIGTFQPAFEYNDGPEITFTISNYNSFSQIQHLHISLVNQKTNQNVLATNANNAISVPSGTYLIDGIWIVPFNGFEKIFTYFDNNNNLYKIKIPNTILKNKNSEFITDYYYKVQLRFDCVTNDILTSSETSENIFDSTYLNNYKVYFSEWSSVSLLKAVPQAEIQLTNFSIIGSDGLTNNNISKKIPQFAPGIIPIVGKLVFYKQNSIIESANEWIKNYQIKVYKKGEESEELILDTDIIYPENYKFNRNKINIESKNESNYWTNNFSYLVDLSTEPSNTNYIINIIIYTKNNYMIKSSFDFKLIDTLFTPNWIWSFNEKKLSYYGSSIDKIITEEDGEIIGTVKADFDSNPASVNYMYQQEPGYMFIRRSDSLSNFKNWTIIKCVECNNPLESVKFTDNTIGSLVQYKYSVQYICYRGGIQTSVTNSPVIIYPDFHDILISSKDKQLAIRYNAQIASMTPVVNRVKIDTLGGRYPKFAENAKLNYKQFNLSGLIVAESDYNRKFLNDLDYSSDMEIYNTNQNGKYLIRNDTVVEDFDSNNFYGTYTNDIVNNLQDSNKKEFTQKNTNHDIYPTENWWWERKFREEVIKWLNDGKPKLYRSMTEGNMIVIFDGITLTPNNQLGRRIWNISCTVYEVGDGYDLELLNNLNIYNIQNDYENKTINFDADTEEDSLIRKTVTMLGQQYEIKALKDSENNPLGIVKNNIIKDINFLYQGLGKNYLYVNNSVFMHNLKIHFTSPPQYYDINSNEKITLLSTIPTKSENEEKINFLDDSYALGYKLNLYYKDNASAVTIFVHSLDNRSGYYQVPSNLLISEIELFDDTVATLDYYLTYKINYYNSAIPDFYSQEETLIGQVNNYWSFGSDIDNYINEKYRVYNWTQTSDYEYAENLVYWKGLTIESDPYSIYEITYKEGINNVVSTNEKNRYIIPRTGTLNLFQDYKIATCRAAGKQMFVVDENRKFYLDEWECVLDDSVTNPYNPGEIVSDGEYWYLVKGSTDIDLDTDINGNYVLVKIRIVNGRIYILNNDLENSEYYLNWEDFNDGVLDIYEDWFNLDEINNCIINNIVIPDYNKVYRIIDNNFVSSYMIYYLNQGWYQAEFFNDSNLDVIQAKVPISGMIEYKADIYKRGWQVINGERQSNLWGNAKFENSQIDQENSTNDDIGS